MCSRSCAQNRKSRLLLHKRKTPFGPSQIKWHLHFYPIHRFVISKKDSILFLPHSVFAAQTLYLLLKTSVNKIRCIIQFFYINLIVLQAQENWENRGCHENADGYTCRIPLQYNWGILFSEDAPSTFSFAILRQLMVPVSFELPEILRRSLPNPDQSGRSPDRGISEADRLQRS